MKLLFIHADFMEYEVTAPIKGLAEEVTDDKKHVRVDEVLTVFTTVEKYDEVNPEAVVDKVVTEIIAVASKVNTTRILLYPYAHLSSELAAPENANRISKMIETKLREQVKEFEIIKSPFGWYKAFRLACKGHPLSELSREIRIGIKEKIEAPGAELVSEAVKAEEKLVSEWFILDLDGNLHPIRTIDDGSSIEGYTFTPELKNLEKFCIYEMAKSRTTGRHPPHIDLMRKLELVDYEPASDPGNFRYYPKGKLIKSLLETYVTEKVKAYGGMEIESPVMYDFDHPSLREYVNRFPARQYTIQTPDKRVFLRFAACFGQFLMAHDASISYKHLPLKLYELTHYSFRVEQRGELAGLRRLRTFTMPDCHAFCADLEMAKRELKNRFELSKSILAGIGFDVPSDLELGLRLTQEFYGGNKQFLVELVKSWGKPALLEIWSEKFFYFVFKYDGNFIDTLGKGSALNTDQIDVENSARYGITYVGADGNKYHPLILHQSPSGAIERVIYALLERAYLRLQQGEKPALPLWLAPTQIRLIPVSSEFIRDCKELATTLSSIRVDIDDRDESVSRKIRDAEQEWVNLIIVYGEQERASGKLPVRRRNGKITYQTPTELKRELEAELKLYPTAPLPLAQLLSQRITFR